MAAANFSECSTTSRAVGVSSSPWDTVESCNHEINIVVNSADMIVPWSADKITNLFPQVNSSQERSEQFVSCYLVL